MDDRQSYWSRRVGRRGVLRATGLGATGLAGAALLGCGPDDDVAPGVPGAPDTNGVEAPVGEVRVEPGLYDGPVPATQAEQNAAEHAREGGTLLVRYLDPPRMDMNRTLSCTIYRTLGYTNNKLTREVLGANADPVEVELEPDLAESWEVEDDGQRFVYHLREGVMTHDKPPTNGREFTSDDVVASLEMYHAGGSQQDVYADVASMKGGFNRWKDEGRPWEQPVTLTHEQMNRYKRHILLPEVGVEGQAKLLASKVLLLGAGGLGRPERSVAELLGRAGDGGRLRRSQRLEAGKCHTEVRRGSHGGEPYVTRRDARRSGSKRRHDPDVPSSDAVGTMAARPHGSLKSRSLWTMRGVAASHSP